MKRLKIHIERIVRPVRASDDTKLKMREELYAHLEEIFREERARLADDEAALAEAKQRLGDPAELTGKLQASVSVFDQFHHRLFGYRWGNESWLRYAVRFSLWMTIYAALLLVAMQGFFLLLTGHGPWVGFLDPEGLAVLAVLLATVPFAVILSTAMWTSWHGIFNATRSRARAFAYGAALGGFGWTIGPGCGLWITHGGFTTEMLLPMGIMILPAALLPVMIAIATRPLAERVRRCQEWEQLELAA